LPNELNIVVAFLKLLYANITKFSVRKLRTRNNFEKGSILNLFSSF
jgi:hypothetical protein